MMPSLFTSPSTILSEVWGCACVPSTTVWLPLSVPEPPMARPVNWSTCLAAATPPPVTLAGTVTLTFSPTAMFWVGSKVTVLVPPPP